jgi:predicted transcriptional regulator
MAPANISLQRLTDEYLLPYGLQAIVIAYFDYPTGVITIQDVMRIPRDRWSETTTGSIATPINQIPALTPDQMVMDALPVLTQSGHAELPVMEDERLVGMLSREQLTRALEIRRRIGVESGPSSTGSSPDHTPVMPEERRTATPGAL